MRTYRVTEPEKREETKAELTQKIQREQRVVVEEGDQKIDSAGEDP